MKVLVTGANGYLGKGVVKKLLDLGADVIATDFTNNLIDNRATFIQGDLFNVDDPYEYFNHPDIVLHMAWRDGFVHNSINHINDLPKHTEFLMKMIHAGIHKICVMGTMHEIGFYEGCIKEDTPCNPQSFYGISKNALRRILEIQCNEFGTIFTWLRGYYIVGNNPGGNSIFSKIIQSANEGKSDFPFTTGENQYDFLEYDDFCLKVAAATIQDKINGIINIANGKPERLSDRVERFIADNNLKIRLKYGAFPDRPYDSKAVWGDNTKIVLIEKEMNH